MEMDRLKGFVYRTVQKTGNEKEVLEPNRSMKTGRLPLVIDQNQTLRSARGWMKVQSHIQTPMGSTLERGGGLQGQILTDDYTFCEPTHGTHGKVPSK